MKKLIIALAVLIVMVPAASWSAMQYKGVLSDVICGMKGTDEAGNDLTKNPEKHTLDFMKQASCVEAGYGIFIRGKNKVYTFHKFDKAGSVMAKEQILDKSVRKDGIAIAVDGQMQKDGTINVKAIHSLELDELYQPSTSGYKKTDK